MRISTWQITRWSDPRIKNDNPGVNLPDKAILPVYRSDGSGTTFIFTDYLSKVSPEWANRVGKNSSVEWLLGNRRGEERRVLGMVRQTPGAFGYVELTYALVNKIEYGAVKNAAGKFRWAQRMAPRLRRLLANTTC